MTQRSIPVEHKVIAVIDNFRCTIPEIKLTKNLSIRRIDTLTEDEQEQFSGDETIFSHISLMNLEGENTGQTFRYITYKSGGGEIFTRTVERADYVFYWYIKERFQEPLKKHYDFLQTPADELGYALSALRVMKDETIGLFPQEHFLIQLPLPIPEGFNRSTQRPQDGYQLSNPNEVEPYVLLPDEVETLTALLTSIRRIKQAGLLTALSRLDNQYTRSHLADRLIDAVIGLESLYAGDNTNEIALRVGLRISAHLGGNKGDLREHYFALFTFAYNLRSRLVHGSILNPREIEQEVQKKKVWKDKDDFMTALDKMLRESLRHILLNVRDKSLKDQLHEPLNKAIRRGEAFSWKS